MKDDDYNCHDIGKKFYFKIPKQLYELSHYVLSCKIYYRMMLDREIIDNVQRFDESCFIS